MVEGDESIAIPFYSCANVAGELYTVWSNEVERLEGHQPQADDEMRRENVERLAQVRRAVAQLAQSWWCVASSLVTRVTEYGVGDEYFCAGQSSFMQEQREVAPRLILRERDAAAIATHATGRFGYEKHLRVQVAIGGTQHAPSPFHTLAEVTCLRLFDQLREGFICIHISIVLYMGSMAFMAS